MKKIQKLLILILKIINSLRLFIFCLILIWLADRLTGEQENHAGIITKNSISPIHLSTITTDLSDN